MLTSENVKNMVLAKFVKGKKKAAKLTQSDFALKAGVRLRFLRDLEQGKKTLRMDKVNQVLSIFGHQLGPVPEIQQNDEQ